MKSLIVIYFPHVMQGGVSEQILQWLWIQVQPVFLCINSASRPNVNILCKNVFILHFKAGCVKTPGSKILFIRGFVHPEMKLSSTHPHVVPNMYDLVLWKTK